MEYLSNQLWVERLGWTLLHFLWQGALIAALYAAARGWLIPQQDARIRYRLACVAMLAFVTAPIVTFAVTGAQEPAPGNPFVGTVPLSSGAGTGSMSPGALLVPDPNAWRGDVMPWVVIGWLVGAIVFWIRLAGGWMVATRMRSVLVRPAPAEWQLALAQLGERLRVCRPVRLLVSAAVQVPTAVGWIRPVVLLPIGALTGLPREHIEALLAHELAHIGRCDYLVNILQSTAEALLFYHPAVWWVSGHARLERELCCDDIAVAMSGDAYGYANALSRLESSRAARFNPALAANGSSLPKRIGRLLGIRPASRPVSASAVIVVVGLILVTALLGLAQATAPKPTFDAASIKLSPPEYVGFQSYAKGDRYTAMTATLRNLVAFAYSIRDFQISGGPSWSDSTAYNIDAKMESSARPDQLRPMLQSLLADRFNLKFHRETKNRSGYALVVDKGGTKITESKNPGPGLGLGKGNLNGRGANMRLLAGELSSQLEQPIADRTGLTALYDFRLTWSPDEQASESTAPSIFTALREQLGLRLDPVRDVPVDFLVIDHADRPSEN